VPFRARPSDCVAPTERWRAAGRDVWGDADPDVAAGGAVAGAFMNAGQYGCGTERVDFVESIADAFTNQVVERVRVGGRGNPDVPGLFHEPTVLVDVDHGMRIMREESFGPILPIVRVSDEEEVIERANDSDCGLGSNSWTREVEKGFRVARRMQAAAAASTT